MELGDLASLATVLVLGIIMVEMISGKQHHEFFRKHSYETFVQYFFRPTSILLALTISSFAGLGIFAGIENGIFIGSKPLYSIGAFAITLLLIPTYMCWDDDGPRKVTILIASILVFVVFFWLSFKLSSDSSLSDIGAIVGLSCFSGPLLASWIKAK